jgi:hypothetical protein
MLPTIFLRPALSERADNTARILDVKYHILLPRVEDVGGALDYYQWPRSSAQALTAYRWVYHDSLKPWLIADSPSSTSRCRARWRAATTSPISTSCRGPISAGPGAAGGR